jgi:hypothetical protein
MSEAVLKKCILQADIPRGDVSRNIESWRHNSQLPIIPFERSLWRGGRYACYTPRVLLQRGVLNGFIRFRLILATAVNSVDYTRKSIQIP